MNQSSDRKTLLLGAYRRAGGDLSKSMSVRDLFPNAKADIDVFKHWEQVAAQLIEVGVLKEKLPSCDPLTVFTITMKGLEQGEKMDATLMKRFASEHPVVLTTVVSILSSIVSGVIVGLIVRR